MHFQLVGISHATAPVEVRERFSLTKEELENALMALKNRLGEGVILSTCNRTEVYATTRFKDPDYRLLKAFWSDFNGQDLGSLSPHLYSYRDMVAANHLFSVASGLDSMVLGEFQILGQVGDAMTAAANAGSLGIPLSGLFHAALRTGRRVRSETTIGRGNLSVSYAGVQLARRVLGDISGRRILLVGAGDTGRLVAEALRTVGASDVRIANRTAARAQEVASRLNGSTVPFEELDGALLDADIVLTSVDSPNHIISQPMLQNVTEKRTQHPMVLIDLAMPRNVDPMAGNLPGVYLYNLDDLVALTEENRESRSQAVAEAEAIIEEEVAKFREWWNSLDAVPIIKAIRHQAEDVRRRELQKALKRMAHLSDEDRQVLEAMTESIVKKMLHHPIKSIKRNGTPSHLKLAQDLFHIHYVGGMGKTGYKQPP